MEKNDNSNFSVCRKIRQAIASNTAVRAIQRISSFNQEPKAPSSSPTNTNIQTKQPPFPQHHKVHTETSSGEIPIMFDYPTPTTSTDSTKKGVGNSVAAKGEPQPKHVPMQGKHQTKAEAQHGHGVHSEQQGKKSIDINDTFREFIQSAKHKIRTVSNVGRGQSNPAAPSDHEAHDTNKNENQKDHFLDFIHRGKKNFRTTTIVGK
ncbi:uncharacterized protein LOC133294609 [Gastrolobium bilobum]|uniref:uncharacterized protein LOC133294609 n=1 Tax=Gastrolobium bilobum TaxID=150636 RepID=UPI002AAF40D0|nr:uncharacterized protein LOC133294609 [Gastrolobium bilobum]